MDTDGARDFLRDNHHAVLHTFRSDGTPQLSPVSVALGPDGDAVVSTRQTAMKAKNLRRDPRAALCVFTDRFFGDWCVIEGECRIVELPDAMEELVDYYRSVSGEHPDWDDYRAAMVRDQRVMLHIPLTRVGPMRSG